MTKNKKDVITKGQLNGPQVERRTYTVEFNATEPTEDGKIRFEGHAAVFNQLTDQGGYFDEIIMPGAFSKAIIQDDVRALFNHDPNIVLGRNKAGTLTLSEDGVGLKVDIDAPDTQLARDLNTSVKRKDVTQMSFAFLPEVEEWDWESEPIKRTIREVKLFDVSIVTYPAYPQTDVTARTFDAAKQKKEAEAAAEAEQKAEAGKKLLELKKKQQKLIEEELT